VRHKPKRLFITIAPQFPCSKGWVVTYTGKNGAIKGVITYSDKISLMLDLEAVIPDDDNSIDTKFEYN